MAMALRRLKSFNNEKTKANLITSIGPKKDGGVVLSGHTDVVPVTGQPWTTDPFNLLEKNARLYGRGTSDMKGFIACCLAIVPDLVQRKRSLFTLHFPMMKRWGAWGPAQSLIDSSKTYRALCYVLL